MPTSGRQPRRDSQPRGIIVGGGPVGLSLAIDLALRGVASTLIEQTDGSIVQPKMDGVNVRTMEFCRRWGISAEVHNCDYPQSYPQDMVYLTSFGGYELGREAFVTPSGGGEERNTGPSPEVRARCPQNLFDPILLGKARRLDNVELRHRTRFLAYEERSDGVVVTVEDIQSGKQDVIEGDYLVGCDGAGSMVRQQAGIGMQGTPNLTYTTNVIFSCPGLQGMHAHRLGYRHLLVGPEGVWAGCVAINGRDQWRLSIIGSLEKRRLTEDEVRAAIERALGMPVAFEVLSIMHWVRQELVASDYRRGRIFIAGDAAHVMSPTGGFGMNTGIADAVDLSWKLAAVLDGWGGKTLLDSYAAERRPVAIRAGREASGNLLRTLSPGANPDLLEPSLRGAKVRYEVGRRYAATMLREWYKLGMDLGYSYAGSPICWADEAVPSADSRPLSPSRVRELHKLAVHLAEGYAVDPGWQDLPAEEVIVYGQSAASGSRAPHVWLADGSSTIDLFGGSHVLLVLGPEAPPADALETAAADARMPLSVKRLDEPDVLAAYGAPLVLVRPDGHVAWRGRKWPAAGVRALVERVTGTEHHADAVAPKRSQHKR